MMGLTEVVIAFRVERADVLAWIEQNWVKPKPAGDDFVFDECDRARLQLICELKRELAVNDEALPLVLSLLDQLYTARLTLHRVGDAIAHLPEAERVELRKLLDRAGPAGGGSD